MKAIIVLIFLTSFCHFTTVGKGSQINQPDKNSSIEGKWVRLTQSGPVGLEFKESGTIEVDFGIDGAVDVVSGYEIRNDTIYFIDRKGEMCLEPGIYKLEITDCYAAFDLVDDMCNGRIKMTMGFWTRPDFEQLTDELSQKIAVSDNPELYLKRARIALALGKSEDARSDLDLYLKSDSSNARVYLNRAGTRFPHDMEGALYDCNKAIELGPENKNVWFLRGLANWELGFKEKACNDFSRAIELGFSILKIAEEHRCSDFWSIDK